MAMSKSATDAQKLSPSTAGSADPLRSLRQRQTYLKIRIPEVKAELKAISEKKTGPGAAGLTVSDKIYLNHRGTALREELKMLDDEKKEVAIKMRSAKK
jgi:hypothetical protein